MPKRVAKDDLVILVDYIKLGVDNSVVFLQNTPENLTFVKDDILYEFCSNDKMSDDSFIRGIKSFLKEDKYYAADISRIPYIIIFKNDNLNKDIGSDVGPLYAKYIVHTIYDHDTIDDDDRELLSDFAGDVYIEMCRRLRKSLRRLRSRMYDSYTPRKTVWQALKEFFGFRKKEVNETTYSYTLAWDQMNLKQIIRNANIEVKKKMSPKDVQRLSEISAVIVITVCVSMSGMMFFQEPSRVYLG